MPPPSVSVRVSFVYYLVSCVVLISAQDYELDDKIKDSIKIANSLKLRPKAADGKFTPTIKNLETTPLVVQEEVGSLSEWLVEGQKKAIPWSDLCPVPVQPHSASACSRRPCAANSDCAPKRNQTYLCCFNGCIDTCMRALEPPPVFDWIDEPPDTKHFIVPEEMASHSSPPESVALPGGCVITPTQFKNLEGFKQNEHVSECFCHVGAVFCKIVQ